MWTRPDRQRRILPDDEAPAIGRAALDAATRYADDRVVSGRPVGQNPGVAFPLAEALTRLDAARLMAGNVAWRHDRGLSCGREANRVKWLGTGAGYQAADRAVQPLGSTGQAKEHHVERYFREARRLRLAPTVGPVDGCCRPSTSRTSRRAWARSPRWAGTPGTCRPSSGSRGAVRRRKKGPGADPSYGRRVARRGGGAAGGTSTMGLTARRAERGPPCQPGTYR
ncbi:acyl-CoA dehydrogenase family protein [Streptomyces pinistramenti]|uniref:acyl-CoA dehydrogenase family protein n=1 Tax=Streptomyces pinistramenti TaxID=2884812 RepID=UPI001D07AD14|nr:acyl-CoA dehydrogenase family protein [Streptomyces pinistramenti]MCB5908232.1 hypothetical protein [Streptomyces pinistramenti]